MHSFSIKHPGLQFEGFISDEGRFACMLPKSGLQHTSKGQVLATRGRPIPVSGIQLQDTQARQEVQGNPLEETNKQGEKTGQKMLKREFFLDAQ
jgi:hypothetical protein